MFVGTDLNGQTFSIYRSATGNSGWTQTGIESPTTCLIAIGICEFNATQASYYASVTPTTTTTSTYGGGGYCTTRYTCTEWSTCSVGTQTRTCSYPSNFCAPNQVKPVETQACTSTTSAGEETNAPGETTTPVARGFFGITGAAIGAALTSPAGIGIMVLIVIVLVGGFMLIQRRSSKKDEEAEEDEEKDSKKKK